MLLRIVPFGFRGPHYHLTYSRSGGVRQERLPSVAIGRI